MTFYVSLVLVIVAAVTLVIGLLQSGLWLVIVSIGASFLAGVFLILTVMRERPQVQPGGVPAAGVPAAAGPPPAPSAMEPAGEELEFPIADYDELKVSEIVPLLPELDDDELDMVREREEDTKGRATILNRIDELLAESEEEWAEEEEPEPATAPVAVYDGADDEEEFPIADYDELKVSEIVPLLPELDDDELEIVREREEDTKGRVSILDRIAELLGEEPPPAPAKKPAAKKPAAKKPAAKKPAAKKPAAKKTTAKKTAAKKTAAKKTAAKKTAAKKTASKKKTSAKKSSAKRSSRR